MSIQFFRNYPDTLIDRFTDCEMAVLESGIAVPLPYFPDDRAITLPFVRLSKPRQLGPSLRALRSYLDRCELLVVGNIRPSASVLSATPFAVNQSTVS